MELALYRVQCRNLDINDAQNPGSVPRGYSITYRFCLHNLYTNYIYLGK
jgi:hypothetical protein